MGIVNGHKLELTTHCNDKRRELIEWQSIDHPLDARMKHPRPVRTRNVLSVFYSLRLPVSASPAQKQNCSITDRGMQGNGNPLFQGGHPYMQPDGVRDSRMDTPNKLNLSVDDPDGNSLDAFPNQGFLLEAFENLDLLIQTLQRAESDHPLASLLFENVMTTRHILNCWRTRGLHDVAVQTIQESLQVQQQTVSKFQTQASISLEGELEMINAPASGRDGSGKRASSLLTKDSWRAVRLRAQLDMLYAVSSERKQEKLTPLFDLRQVVTVKEVHNGKGADFDVQTAMLGPNHYPLPGKEDKLFHFRAANDRERQLWLSLFDSYRNRTIAKQTLQTMKIGERVRFYKKHVFKPYEAMAPEKDLEFMFATDRLLPRLDEEKEMKKVGLKRCFLATKSGGPSLKSNKNMDREIEIDLSRPRRLLISKLEVAGQNSAPEPPLEYKHSQFQDYQVLPASLKDLKRTIELTFNNVKGQKKTRGYTFESASQAGRFLEFLYLFQQIEEGESLTFINQGTVHLLVQATNLLTPRHPSLNPSHDTLDDVTGQHLHWLLVSIQSSIPLNTHAAEMLRFSNDQPLSIQGDIARLFFLANKLDVLQGVSSQHSTCQCTTESCLVLLLKSFLALRGFVNVHFCLLYSEGPLQQLSLKILWQVFRLKHLLLTCTGTVLRPSLTAQVSANAESAMVSVDQVWDPYTRLSFSWYLESLAMHREISADLVQTLLELLMGKHVQAHRGGLSDKKQLQELPVLEPDLLPVVFLAAQSADPAGSELALGFMIALVNHPYHSIENSKRFIQEKTFQTWIFPFLVEEYSMRTLSGKSQRPARSPRKPFQKSPSRQLDNGPGKESKIYQLAMCLLRDLHLAAMTRPTPVLKAGECPVRTSLLYRTAASVHEYAGGPFEDVLKLLRLLLSQMCRSLQQMLAGSNLQDLLDSPVWIHHMPTFLSVVEEMLLYNPLPGAAYKKSATDVSWGAHLDRSRVDGVQDLVCLDAVVDLLCVFGNVLIRGGAGSLEQSHMSPQQSNQVSALQAGVLTDYRYFVMVREVLQNAAAAQGADLDRHMQNLAMLMTERNKTVSVPVQRRKVVIALGKSVNGPKQSKKDIVAKMHSISVERIGDEVDLAHYVGRVREGTLEAEEAKDHLSLAAITLNLNARMDQDNPQHGLNPALGYMPTPRRLGLTASGRSSSGQALAITDNSRNFPAPALAPLQAPKLFSQQVPFSPPPMAGMVSPPPMLSVEKGVSSTRMLPVSTLPSANSPYETTVSPPGSATKTTSSKLEVIQSLNL
eukprot:g12969.t1